MIQRKLKSDDLLVRLKISDQRFNAIRVEYYTDESLYKYSVTVVESSSVVYESVDTNIIIPSEELTKMSDGQLKSRTYITLSDTRYSDSTYDTSEETLFDIWLSE